MSLFEGLTFFISSEIAGKQKLEHLIQTHGGAVTLIVTRSVDYVIATKQEALERNSSVQRAAKAGTHCVSPDWALKSVELETVLNPAKFLLLDMEDLETDPDFRPARPSLSSSSNRKSSSTIVTTNKPHSSATAMSTATTSQGHRPHLAAHRGTRMVQPVKKTSSPAKKKTKSAKSVEETDSDDEDDENFSIPPRPSSTKTPKTTKAPHNESPSAASRGRGRPPTSGPPPATSSSAKTTKESLASSSKSLKRSRSASSLTSATSRKNEPISHKRAKGATNKVIAQSAAAQQQKRELAKQKAIAAQALAQKLQAEKEAAAAARAKAQAQAAWLKKTAGLRTLASAMRDMDRYTRCLQEMGMDLTADSICYVSEQQLVIASAILQEMQRLVSVPETELCRPFPVDADDGVVVPSENPQELPQPVTNEPPTTSPEARGLIDAEEPGVSGPPEQSLAEPMNSEMVAAIDFDAPILVLPSDVSLDDAGAEKKDDELEPEQQDNRGEAMMGQIADEPPATSDMDLDLAKSSGAVEAQKKDEEGKDTNEEVQGGATEGMDVDNETPKEAVDGDGGDKEPTPLLVEVASPATGEGEEIAANPPPAENALNPPTTVLSEDGNATDKPSSSATEQEASPIPEDAVKVGPTEKEMMLKVLDELSAEDKLKAFESDPTSIPYYTQHIQRPMWMQRIREKVNTQQRYGWKHMKHDLDTVYSNAMKYNDKGTVFHETARTLKALAIRSINPHIARIQLAQRNARMEKRVVVKIEPQEADGAVESSKVAGAPSTTTSGLIQSPAYHGRPLGTPKKGRPPRAHHHGTAPLFRSPRLTRHSERLPVPDQPSASCALTFLENEPCASSRLPVQPPSAEMVARQHRLKSISETLQELSQTFYACVPFHSAHRCPIATLSAIQHRCYQLRRLRAIQTGVQLMSRHLHDQLVPTNVVGAEVTLVSKPIQEHVKKLFTAGQPHPSPPQPHPAPFGMPHPVVAVGGHEPLSAPSAPHVFATPKALRYTYVEHATRTSEKVKKEVKEKQQQTPTSSASLASELTKPSGPPANPSLLSFGIEIMEVFRVDRQGERSRFFAELAKGGSKYVVPAFAAIRVECMAHILRHGFVDPSSVSCPTSFVPQFFRNPLKAAEFCFSNPMEPIGYLALIFVQQPAGELAPSGPTRAASRVRWVGGIDESDLMPPGGASGEGTNALNKKLKKGSEDGFASDPGGAVFTVQSNDQIAWVYLLHLKFNWKV